MDMDIPLTDDASLRPLVRPARADAAAPLPPAFSTNDALGFTARAHEGAWKKELT